MVGAAKKGGPEGGSTLADSLPLLLGQHFTNYWVVMTTSGQSIYRQYLFY